MNSIKQGMAAIMLVLSLGCVLPGALGGSASADFKPDNHQIADPDSIDCDLDRNGSYETHYDLEQLLAPPNLLDKNSNTVIVLRQTELLYSDYTVVHDPTGTAVDFHDPIGYWDTEPHYINPAPNEDHASPPNAQRKGQKQVLCTTFYEYNYAPYASDVETGAGFVASGDWAHNFVQTDACPEESDVPREELPECVTYQEKDTWQWVVTISGTPVSPKSVKAASVDNGGTQSATSAAADGKQHAHRSHNAKHRGKGQHSH
jgi:hypothetical protein